MAVDIERLRALLAKATAGEWKAGEDDNGEPWILVDHPSVPDAVSILFDSDWGTADDAALVAAAINALPALLYELAASRAKEER